MPSLPFRVVLPSILAVLLFFGVACSANAQQVDRDNPTLFIDIWSNGPSQDTLETISVTGYPIKPPLLNGPRIYGGIGPISDVDGRGGHGEPFEPNRGENQLVHDASEGDPCSKGSPDASGANPQSGNPIVLSTGNKVEAEVDFTSAGEMPLTLIRTYNHYWNYVGLFGKHWLSNLDYSIVIASDESTIFAQRPDGRRIKFIRDPNNSNRWNEDRPTPVAFITRSGSNYVYSTEDNFSETYDGEGRILVRTNVNGLTWRFTYTNRFLTSVTHSSGRLNGSSADRKMTLAWDYAHGKLLSIVAPDGSTFAYSYTADAFGPGLNRLASVTTPNFLFNPSVTTTYHYEDVRFPGALTGKSFNNARYSTFVYDANARATDSKHAGPIAGAYVDTYHFSYSGAPYNPPPGGPGDPPPPGAECDTTTHQCPLPPFAPDPNTPVAALNTAAEAAAAEDALVSMIPDVTNTVTKTNPLGLQTIYTFVNGQLTATSGLASQYCGARSSSRTYDANGYDNQVSDFKGNVTDYNYAANGQLSQKVEALGSSVARTTSYTWDTVRIRPLTNTVNGLSQTTYVYSPENRIASVTIKNLTAYGVPNQTRSWTYQYTRWGVTGTLKTVVADGPLSNDEVTTSYSEDGDVLTVDSPTGTTTYSGYDGMGRPSRVVGENGEVVDYAYYPGGALKTITTYPNGTTPAATTFVYANGLLKSVTSAGVTTEYAYDIARRQVSTTRQVIGGSAMRTLTYDASSNVTKVENALNGVVKYRDYIDYDELDRVRARRGNNFQNYKYTYDDNGNLETVTDPYTKTTTYSYDALNRLSTSKEPLQPISTFQYDAADRLKSITDSHAVTTTYQRDGFGQLWKESSPDRGTTAYAYLGDGLLDTMTRGNGVQTTYHFDGMGRLTSLTASGQSQTFAYDLCTNGIGRLCSAAAPTTTLSYTYEPDGRVRSRKDVITAGSAGTYTTTYLYDAVGRLSSLTYPNNEVATYTYSTGQPSSMTMTIAGVQKSVVAGANFEPFGRLSGYTHGNNLVRDYVFDLNGRYSGVSGITSKNGATALQSLGYGYDNDDRITTITSNVSGYSESYGYDDLSRLTSAAPNLGYSYDSNGNRMTMDPFSSAYTYFAGTNRIKSVSNVFIAPDMTIGSGTSSPATPAYASNFSYDGAGNIKEWDFPATLTATYTYDGFNRMTTVADTYAVPTTTYGQYGYNAYGERTNKRDAVNAHNYSFIYDEGHQLIGDRKDTVWTNYIWFAGELVGMTRGGALFQIDNDHLGRPELITNASRAIVWQSNNDPFGGMNPTTNTIGEFNIGFPGQYYDVETKYWYNVNRYYIAALGRYLQPDPIGLAGGLNPYAYASNNPAGLVDALGLANYPYEFVGPLNAGDIRCPLPGSDAIQSIFPEGYLLGGGRLAYAGLARAVPYVASTFGSSAIGEAALAASTRNSLKDLFRLPLTPFLSGWRQPSFAELYAKYAGDLSKVVAGSATTNAGYNGLGVAGVAAGAAQGSVGPGSAGDCGCGN